MSSNCEPQQEPVAWMHWLHGPVRLFLNKDEAMMELDRLNREYPVDKDARQMKPLYTTPPQRKPLTDEQLDKAAMKLAECMDYPWAQMPEQGKQNMRDHAKAIIEAAHGIKE